MPRLQSFLLVRRELHHEFLQRKCFSPSLTKMLTRGDVVEKNKTRFFYVLYSDEISPVYDQSERAQGLIYIIISDKKRDLH